MYKRQVDGTEWEPGILMGKFLCQALRLLGVPDPARSISAFMVTVPEITGVLVENMREAFRELGCAENRTFLQSRCLLYTSASAGEGDGPLIF